MRKNLLLAAIAVLSLAAPAVGAPITNVDFTPDSPADLPFGAHVNFTFDYDVSQDAVIFGRPFFMGALRIDYAAHPAGVYQTGLGSGSGFFTITDQGQGVAHVDQVRFQILAFDQSALLHETFVPVDFTFGRIPEPGSLSLLVTGLLGLAGLRRRPHRDDAR